MRYHDNLLRRLRQEQMLVNNIDEGIDSQKFSYKSLPKTWDKVDFHFYDVRRVPLGFGV